MSKIKTFVDANVLIGAFRGNDEICQKALEIIDDPNREFITSDHLKLELIPKPTFFRYQEEIQFMKAFFDIATFEIDIMPATTAKALELACKYGLSAMDALHAEVSIEMRADILFTIEKPSKPLSRVQELKVEYI